MPTGRNVIRSLRRRIRHQTNICTQLETDQRTYGSIGRENSPTFAGWKETPEIDLVAVLQNQREYSKTLKQRQLEVKRLQEEDESTVLE